MIALDPKHAEAYNYIGYMYAESGQNLAEAIELIQKALALEPENGYFIDSLGWAYYQQGTLSRGPARAAARGRAWPRKTRCIFEHLGDAYLKNGLRRGGHRARGRRRSRWTRTTRTADSVKKKLQDAREKQLRVKGGAAQGRAEVAALRLAGGLLLAAGAVGACASAAAGARAARLAEVPSGRARRARAARWRASTTSAPWPTSPIRRGGADAAALRACCSSGAPASLRFEALSPFGPPVLDRGRRSPESVTLWEVLDNRAYLAAASPDANRRWLGLALGREDLVALLAGTRPAAAGPDAGGAAAPDETGPSLRLAGRRRRAAHLARPATGRPRQVEWTGARIPARVTFTRETAAEAPPTGLTLADPRRQARGLGASTASPQLNTGSTPTLLQLTVPQDVKIQDFR